MGRWWFSVEVMHLDVQGCPEGTARTQDGVVMQVFAHHHLCFTRSLPVLFLREVQTIWAEVLLPPLIDSYVTSRSLPHVMWG